MELNIEEFVQAYVAVWNEPDPAARRRSIAELWTEDAVQYLESAEYRGHRELEPRVAEAYQKFVAAGFVFAPAAAPVAHHDTVVLRIKMIPAGGGDVAWTGLCCLELAADGRIRRDHQYALPAEPTRTVVGEFLARLGAGDPERIAELFAEPVDWWVDWPAEGHPGVPWIRPRSSRADVADHFRALAEFHLPGREAAAEPMTVLVDGADAVVLGEIRQTARATGRAYTAGCALRLTVENGLITRYHVYEDSLSVARAFEATPTPARG
jgi:ketosteroid isomerase-like protein